MPSESDGVEFAGTRTASRATSCSTGIRHIPRSLSPPAAAATPSVRPLLLPFPLPSPSDLPPNAEFLPLTGNWIVSALKRTLPPHLQRLWSFTGDKSRLDKSRGEGPIVRRDLDTGVVREIRVPEAQTVKARL